MSKRGLGSFRPVGRGGAGHGGRRSGVHCPHIGEAEKLGSDHSDSDDLLVDVEGAYRARGETKSVDYAGSNYFAFYACTICTVQYIT